MQKNNSDNNRASGTNETNEYTDTRINSRKTHETIISYRPCLFFPTPTLTENRVLLMYNIHVAFRYLLPFGYPRDAEGERGKRTCEHAYT